VQTSVGRGPDIAICICDSRERKSRAVQSRAYIASRSGDWPQTQEVALKGLDLHEHGVPAYPEYALHGSASPQGAPAFTEAAFGAEARAAMVQAQKMAHT